MGRTNCDCKCIKDPSGLWSYKNMIGSKVYVKSMPVSNFFFMQDADCPCTISDIEFRVTIDGKTITVIKLKEYPTKEFTWKDLMVDKIGDRDVREELGGKPVPPRKECNGVKVKVYEKSKKSRSGKDEDFKHGN